MYTIDGNKEFENLTQMVKHYQQKDAYRLTYRLQVPVVKEGKQILKYSVEMDDFIRSEE